MSTFDTLRARIAAAPTTVAVDAVMSDVYAALSTNEITEAEAETLDRLARQRQGRPGWEPTTAKPLAPPRRLGSTPRTSESIERRRTWAASGWLPPEIAKNYTLGGQAVLAIVASEIAANGRCDLAVAAIAGRAGVGDTVTRDTLRRARDLGHLQSAERRRSYDRSDTSIRTILHKGWQRWITRPRRNAPGVGIAMTTNTLFLNQGSSGSLQSPKMVSEAGKWRRRKGSSPLW